MSNSSNNTNKDLFYEIGKDLYFIHSNAGLIMFLQTENAISLLSNKALEKIKKSVDNNLIHRNVITRLIEKKYNILTDNNIESDLISERNCAFTPSMCTFILSHKCNLSCLYCYAGASQIDTDTITCSMINQTIDFLFENLIKNNLCDTHITLHGGGEPLLESNFDTISHIINYSEKHGRKKGIKTTFSSITNGTFTNNVFENIVSKFSRITFSYDGLPEFQNVNRPNLSGNGVNSVVENNMKKVNEARIPLSIRCTITNESVHHMARIVKYLTKKYEVTTIHFEPLYPIGRGKYQTRLSSPHPNDFAVNFGEAFKTSKSCSTKVFYSGANLSVKKYYCGGCGFNMVILPNGEITTCVEVSRPNDPFLPIFKIGQVCGETCEISQLQINKLRDRTIKKMPECTQCFARKFCAGGCPVKSLRTSGSIFEHGENIQCKITKKVAEEALKYIAISQINSTL